MKYIRTKDGVHELFFVDKDFIEDIYNCKDGRKFYKDEIIKQADTIEELCDRFVYRQQLYEDFEFMKGQDIPTINYTMAKTKDKIILSFIKDQVDMCEDKHIFSKKEWGKIYGAIWIGKGLIYVAKMNEKGELELL